MRRLLPVLAAVLVVALAGLAAAWLLAGPDEVGKAPAPRGPAAPPAKPPARPADLGEVRPPAPPAEAPPAEADQPARPPAEPPVEPPPAKVAEPKVGHEDPVPVAPRLPPEERTDPDVLAAADGLGAELAAWAAKLPEAAKDAPKPKVLVLPFKNLTDRRIADREIAGRLEAATAKSGRLEFLGGEAAEALAKEYAYMASGRAKPEDRKFGADYVLLGQIDSLAVRKGDAKVAHYYLVLNLVDTGSGARAWRAEREIVKQPAAPAK